jgi:serine/threonine protein kinase
MHSSVYFIYDYAFHRDLATHGLLYGGTEQQLSVDHIRTYLRQLLSALVYCHDRLVYHCAVELKHLLIVQPGHLKLSNFQFAKHAHQPQINVEISEVTCGTSDVTVGQSIV